MISDPFLQLISTYSWDGENTLKAYNVHTNWVEIQHMIMCDSRDVFDFFLGVRDTANRVVGGTWEDSVRLCDPVLFSLVKDKGSLYISLIQRKIIKS